MNKKNDNSSYSSLTGVHRAVPIILYALAAFLSLCFIFQDIGSFGVGIRSVLLGLFSKGAYAIPALLIIHALFYPIDLEEKRIWSRAIFSLIITVGIAAFAYAI